MSDHLPPEVLTDIFTKLTINEIGRCISVCKSWYSLITSPSFVSLHTKLITSSPATTTNTLLLVRDYVSIDYWETTHSEHYSIHYDTDGFIGRIKTFDFPFKTWNPNFRVVGCFNGVVCLSNDLISYSDEVVLWNPSINKALTLPKPLVSFESPFSFVHSIGFCFDSAKDDYKVVKVVNLIDFWADEVPPHVEVYELKIGYWRSINLRMKIPYVIDQRSPQAFLNGSVHWVGYKREDAKIKRILSFDMKKEVFHVMKLPDCFVSDDRRTNFRVSVMGESLALIPYNRHGCHYSCDIWVMKQYGVCNSWTKQFSVQLIGGLREVFGFRRNGEALFSQRFGEATTLVSYDAVSREVKYVDVFQGKKSFEVEHFVESLALLDVKGQSSKKIRSDNVVVSNGDLDDVHVQKKMKSK